MSEVDDKKIQNLINENNNEEENSQKKKSTKRRRKELIDNDNDDKSKEENQIINENTNNEFEIIQNEEIKGNNINEENDNKFKTLASGHNTHSPFRNNLLLQEKLKKIFLNREKINLQYTKHELPDHLKYHSDDSDSSDSTRIRKSKMLKRENKNKENNLISKISNIKNIEIKNNKKEEENNKIDEIKINNKNNNDLNEDKNEKNILEVNEELKTDLTKNYNEDIIQKEKLKEDNIKNEELLPISKNPEQENLSNLSNNDNNDNINTCNKQQECNNINEEEQRRNKYINQIKLEIKKEEKLNMQNKRIINSNFLRKNKLIIDINQNQYNEKTRKTDKKNNDLFDIIEKLKKNQAESVNNKSNKKKLDIIKFPKEERNQKNYNDFNIVKNNEINDNKQKDNINQNLNIFLTKKDSKKNILKEDKIQTIDLSYKKVEKPREINISYSSKGIPHKKYEENISNKKLSINNNNNIPTRKASNINRYQNTPIENSIDIDLNTTPSSHLDRSYDAINTNKTNNLSKEKKSINVYRPKKINNFNNFFNSPNIYRNNNKNSFHKKNQKSFSEYAVENINQNEINIESIINNEVNNSFDGYMNMNNNINKKNILNGNEYIYFHNDENKKNDNIPRYKPINVIPINQFNNNRNLVFNNFYRNENNNKSFGNIFNGVNNNIFDNNNYNTDDYLGNMSTKNNLVQNPKFITYNILNPNPLQRKYPIKTILNTTNQNNIFYPNSNSITNINIPSRRGTTSIISNCIYNNKYNSIYSNNSNISNIQKNENKKTKNTSINIEDLLVLEEKMNEIILGLNKNGMMHNECFEFWNYYYNCSLLGQLEQLFKNQNDKTNIQISINHILMSIMICYDYSYEIEILNGDYSILEELLNITHKILMVIYEHILSKISSESKANIWVFKLKNLINNFNKKSNKDDYFKNSSQMSCVEKIIYNTSAIVQNIRILLKHYKTKNISYLTSLFKKISEKTYEEIDTYFRDNIFRVDNFNGSVLASVFLKENENFKTEPAPYIHTINRKKYSLILDLDETLIHFKVNNDDDSEGMLQIRPGVIPFLEKIGQYYELIVFTAATQDYGDLLIDAIEENNVYFEHRFYRQHTIIIGNDFVKDLNRIGRPLDKIIIVDNMPQNFRLQKENGINIKAFWGEDVNDNALEELGIILVNIAKDGGDVRKGLIKYKDEIIRKVTSNISRNNY